LPSRYNDGSAVEEEKFSQTRRELTAQFGAITWHPERLQGIWSHEGKVFEDANIKVVIDVEPTPETHAFFQEFKERLKERFRQIDIWMVSYQIEIH
jgi:hypothetical protein